MGKISNSAKTNWALDWAVGKKGRDIIENEAEFMTEASATTYLFSTRIPARKRSTYPPHLRSWFNSADDSESWLFSK